jgi:hypothetical protein
MTPVGQEIVALTATDGSIYPNVVVDWAQANPESELHRHFKWDINKAAREHWLWQARQLIAIHVVDLRRDRMTISLQIDRGRGGGYRHLGNVLSNAELRRQACEQAIGELHRWAERHRHLSELQGIFRAVDRVARTFDDGEADRDAA